MRLLVDMIFGVESVSERSDDASTRPTATDTPLPFICYGKIHLLYRQQASKIHINSDTGLIDVLFPFENIDKIDVTVVHETNYNSSAQRKRSSLECESGSEFCRARLASMYL